MPHEQHHPTRERLVATTADILDEVPAEKLHVEDILIRSGVSKGSMYYHFEDFSDLLDAAYVRRFALNVDANIDWLAGLLSSADSRDSFLAGLRELTRLSQSPDRAPVRLERARVLGMTADSPRLRERLASEQGRLTEALTDLVREAQAKGWISVEVDPHATAVFIQSYTLGQIVNDVATEGMAIDAWNALIDRVLSRAFATE